jgi:hypothetical protein
MASVFQKYPKNPAKKEQNDRIYLIPQQKMPII